MVSTVANSYRTYLIMDDNEAIQKTIPTERIRFEVLDEEAAAATSSPKHNDATGRRPGLVRSSTAISEDSMSIRAGSRRGSMSIEPAAALPIQYRTL